MENSIIVNICRFLAFPIRFTGEIIEEKDVLLRQDFRNNMYGTRENI